MTTAPVILNEDARRIAWLADKQKAIGGTEVAAILGLSKFKSPMQVYLEKKGLAETLQNEPMRWGKRLERGILDGYAEEVGQPIIYADPYEFIRSKQLPILGATLDARWADGDRRPVDAKNTRWKSDEWGEAGSDQIPLYYACQLAVQMHVTDAPAADLAVLFSGQQFERFTVYRDLDTEATILERVHLWWERHIVQDIPPEVDGSKGTAEWLGKRFRQATDMMAPATPELTEAARALAKIKAEAKRLELEQGRLENILKQATMDNAGIAGLCSWKQAKDGEATDWKGIVTHINPDPAIIKQFTTTKPGSRRFLLTLKEAE